MTVAARIGTSWQQSGLNPVYALQVFGMRRSGNHAIIDWLMRNAPKTATGGVFFNNCRFGRDPVRAYGSLDVYDADSAMVPRKGTTDPARIVLAGEAPMVVVSYEDRMPQPAGRPQRASGGMDSTDFIHQVVIYRSFLNWSASLLAKIKRNDGFGMTDRARIMVLALANYIHGLDRVADAKGVIAICYDEWMTSKGYRADILRALGLPERDLNRGKIQHYGGGSSFQPDATVAGDLHSTARDAALAADTEYKLLLWTVAHDPRFMERLIPHFEQDAERLATLAETAKLQIKLPPREAIT